MPDASASVTAIHAALDELSVSQRGDLIRVAEEKRKEKLETAKQTLVTEFRAKLGVGQEFDFRG